MAPTNTTTLKSMILRLFEICYGHQIASEYDHANQTSDTTQDSYMAIWSTSGEYHGNLHNNQPRD
jgi:hypothetical protein